MQIAWRQFYHSLRGKSTFLWNIDRLQRFFGAQAVVWGARAGPRYGYMPKLRARPESRVARSSTC